MSVRSALPADFANPEPFATVRWEPCADTPQASADGVCTDCGWLVADHEGPGAVIVVVPRRVPARLARAS